LFWRGKTERFGAAGSGQLVADPVITWRIVIPEESARLEHSARSKQQSAALWTATSEAPGLRIDPDPRRMTEARLNGLWLTTQWFKGGRMQRLYQGKAPIGGHGSNDALPGRAATQLCAALSVPETSRSQAALPPPDLNDGEHGKHYLRSETDRSSRRSACGNLIH
jgi:hypothetical protein